MEIVLGKGSPSAVDPPAATCDSNGDGGRGSREMRITRHGSLASLGLVDFGIETRSSDETKQRSVVVSHQSVCICHTRLLLA